MKIIVLTVLIGAIAAMAHLGGPLAMNSKPARARKALKRWDSVLVFGAGD